MANPISITLAGKSYEIAPFTLRQLQRIELAEAKAVLQRRRTIDDSGALDHDAVLANVESEMAKIAEVIRIALSKDHGDVAEGLEDMAGLKAHEINAAYEAVLDFGGFRKAEPVAEPAPVAEPVKPGRKRKAEPVA